jgi:hypothetical protein
MDFSFAHVDYQGIDTETIAYLVVRLQGIINYLKKHDKTINGYSVFRSRFHENVVVIIIKDNVITFKTTPTNMI